MRYLKTYEKAIRSYKNYLLISGENTSFDDYNKIKKYYIVIFIAEFDNMLSVKFVFGYNDPNDYEKISRGNGGNGFNLNKKNIDILYQSDRFYECKDYLINAIEKYNI